MARRFPSLNILLCNASVLNTRRGETKDGYEITFQVAVCLFDGNLGVSFQAGPNGNVVLNQAEQKYVFFWKFDPHNNILNMRNITSFPQGNPN